MQAGDCIACRNASWVGSASTPTTSAVLRSGWYAGWASGASSRSLSGATGTAETLAKISRCSVTYGVTLEDANTTAPSERLASRSSRLKRTAERGARKAQATLIAANQRAARARWGKVTRLARQALEQLTREHVLAVASGEVQLLDQTWYVTHSGLLQIARRQHCAGIHVEPVQEFCTPETSSWAFKAVVYTASECRGFCGYGDATPANVSPQLRGAEMRIAETRAVNRALRKAYAIGLCSVEELSVQGSAPAPSAISKKPVAKADVAAGDGDGRYDVGGQNGSRRLRDRLCLLIHQHRLDAGQVKEYAADFCGVGELRHATRQQVEDLLEHLARRATDDRQGLLCDLNSYPASDVCDPPRGATLQAEQGNEAPKEQPELCLAGHGSGGITK